MVGKLLSSSGYCVQPFNFSSMLINLERNNYLISLMNSTLHCTECAKYIWFPQIMAININYRGR